MKTSQGLWFGISIAISAVSTVEVRADLDLTSLNAQGTINGAVFQQFVLQPAGTGAFGTFVRVQNKGTEKGYNTDGTLEFDTKGGAHTHSLLLSDVPVINVSGTDYREFLLDINEPNGQDKNLLSLDDLKIHLESSGNLSGYPQNFSSPIYDLDAGGNNSIKLDSGLAPGSGKSDLRALIPDSLFSGGTFVYLYSAFGETFPSEGGFEEWGVRKSENNPPPPIPSPGAFVLGIIGLGFIGTVSRKLPVTI